MEDDKALIEEGEIHDDDCDKDEDVPDNFFDDFNNEGFMESLQIVDSLDDTNAIGEIEGDIENDQKDNVNNIDEKSPEDPNDRKKPKRSSDRKRSKSRDRRSRKESPHRKRKFDETALCRDPDKTRKALEKDRQNFFKKNKQKVISKIIETGLVPPGMESEVNLSSIETQKTKEVEKEEKEKCELDGATMREGKMGKEKRTSNEKRSLKSKERRSTKSKERRRRRSRSRSYGRYRSRSRGKRIERRAEIRRSFDRRSRSKSRGKVFDQELYSPVHRRRRSRSVSDRERWLRDRSRSVDRKYQNRSPDRKYPDRSQERKYQRHSSERKYKDSSPEKKYQGLIGEKKMSFLEEINMKLNGEFGHSSGDAVAYPNPKNPVQPKIPQNVYPIPVPIPHPQFNQNFMMGRQPTGAPMNMTYTEEFFIGNQCNAPVPSNIPQMMPVVNHQGMIPIGTTANLYATPAPTVPASAAPVPPPNDTSDISAKVSLLLSRISATTKNNLDQTGGNPLEKPLSLTDFLQINPSPDISSKPEALRKKIDVLSRCQDFMKEISGDNKASGKLRVSRINPSTNKEKNISPLLRQKPLKFSFNVPSSDNNYQQILTRALVKTGLVGEVLDIVDDDDKLNTPAPAAGKRKRQSDADEGPRNLSKMCQTDPISCEDCEMRKTIQYRSIGIQCGESERYNVGVQVVEEDILNFRIPKNQSLAHLTPAQLLGRSEPVSTRADNFSSVATGPDRLAQPVYRDGANWNRPRDYYDDPARDYYGREQRFPRY